MRIAMIGGGYVGLVSAACFAEFGTEVTVVETDPARLAALAEGRMPIYEPGLDQLVATNVKAGRLAFTADLAAALHEAEAVFIAVGTPTRRGDGHADLSYVYAAAEQVARALTGHTVIVTKSTVPVGTGRRIAEIVRAARPDLDFDVASNPEFLREGNAIGDFMRPDRVVIGTESERAREVMRRLYRPLYLIEAPNLIEAPIVFTGIETAELTKYAANAFVLPMSAEQRLASLGLTLPPPPTPIGNYVPFHLAGNLLFLSGVGPRQPDGSIITGKLGAELDVARGYAAARMCGLNLLVNIRAAAGSLDRVGTILKVLGMVNAVPSFTDHPQVIDGCTDLFVAVFGEAGRPARSAVGMGSLPRNISVEVEAVVLLQN